MSARLMMPTMRPFSTKGRGSAWRSTMSVAASSTLGSGPIEHLGRDVDPDDAVEAAGQGLADPPEPTPDLDRQGLPARVYRCVLERFGNDESTRLEELIQVRVGVVEAGVHVPEGIAARALVPIRAHVPSTSPASQGPLA